MTNHVQYRLCLLSHIIRELQIPAIFSCFLNYSRNIIIIINKFKIIKFTKFRIQRHVQTHKVKVHLFPFSFLPALYLKICKINMLKWSSLPFYCNSNIYNSRYYYKYFQIQSVSLDHLNSDIHSLS